MASPQVQVPGPLVPGCRGHHETSGTTGAACSSCCSARTCCSSGDDNPASAPAAARTPLKAGSPAQYSGAGGAMEALLLAARVHQEVCRGQLQGQVAGAPQLTSQAVPDPPQQPGSELCAAGAALLPAAPAPRRGVKRSAGTLPAAAPLAHPAAVEACELRVAAARSPKRRQLLPPAASQDGPPSHGHLRDHWLLLRDHWVLLTMWGMGSALASLPPSQAAEVHAARLFLAQF